MANNFPNKTVKIFDGSNGLSCPILDIDSEYPLKSYTNGEVQCVN